MFPDEEMLGVDLVIPDVTYVQERIKKLRAILITHGHEDHVGALPYVLPKLRLPNGKLPPVYCTPLTHGLIAVKLEEHKLLEEGRPARGRTPGDDVQARQVSPPSGSTSRTASRTRLASPCSTPVGTVFHTGDFKFDHTPVMGRPPTSSRIAELGREGVLLLLSDSTYADTRRLHPVRAGRRRGAATSIMANAEGRVIVATFASLIARVQQVIDAAEAQRPRVFVTGRSMMNNVEMAVEQGYLNVPPDILEPARPDEEAARPRRSRSSPPAPRASPPPRSCAWRTATTGTSRS